MKKLMKIASALLVIAMMFMTITPAYAADESNYKITINNDKTDHTYSAYQVFKGNISGGKLTNIVWGNGVDLKKNTNEEVVLINEIKAINIGTEDVPNKPFANVSSATDVANVLKTADASTVDAFAKVINNHLSTTKVDSVYSGGKYVINVSSEGYYFVKDTKEIAAGDSQTKYILRVLGNVEINAKTDEPTLKKKIVVANNEIDANSASIGQTVNYQLTVKIPDMTNYNNYTLKIHDLLAEGLALNADSITISVDGKNDVTFVKGTDYTVSTVEHKESDTLVCNLEINFEDVKAKLNAYAGSNLIVKYNATVDTDAVIGSGGNANTAWLEYSNNPNNTTVTGTTPKDSVVTYVTGIKIVKVDENNNALAGATFQIEGESVNTVIVKQEVYKEVSANGTHFKLLDGTYTTEAPTAETASQYENGLSSEQKYALGINEEIVTKEENVKITKSVGVDGILSLEGLGEGTYTITETEAPEGYNKVSNITVKININSDGTISTDGNIGTVENGVVVLTVVNKQGTTLPETGGMGTTLLYIAGGAMVIGAAMLLIVKKRMENE